MGAVAPIEVSFFFGSAAGGRIADITGLDLHLKAGPDKVPLCFFTGFGERFPFLLSRV